jgi:hypothetical protein
MTSKHSSGHIGKIGCSNQHQRGWRPPLPRRKSTNPPENSFDCQANGKTLLLSPAPPIETEGLFLDVFHNESLGA